MNDFEKLSKQIKFNENRAQSLHNKIYQLNQTIEGLVKERQQVCKHTQLTTHDRSYEEVKFESIYYQEQVCDNCGKVVAHRQEQSIMSKWQHV